MIKSRPMSTRWASTSRPSPPPLDQTSPTRRRLPRSPSPAAVATAPPVATTVVGSPDAATPREKPRRSTPQMLRLLSVGTILISLIFGVLGALIFSYLAFSLYRAEANITQLIRVQKIETNLLAADATATNAFLVGGLAPPAQRAAYEQAITEATALIAEAARAQPADGAALSALNNEVLRYASMVEQARANNRQGLPVGAQYLRIASSELRTVALPILTNLVQANAERASAAMETEVPAIVFVAIGVLVVAGLILVMAWLTRTFKRWINPGLAAAAGLLLIVLIGGAIVLTSTASGVAELRSGSFNRLTLATQARISANNAKSNESLTLIARGSGAAFEDAWQASAREVTANLDQLDNPELVERWNQYAEVHTALRQLDEGGRWEQAVSRATGSGANSSNARFTAFDVPTADFVDEMAGITRDGLSGPRTALTIGAVLI